MLDDEVAIEENGFHSGEQGIIAVEIGPASLHHADVDAAVRVEKVGNCAAQEIGGRQKVCIEDGDVLTFCGLQSVLERARLVALTIGTMNIGDGQSFGSVAFDAGASDIAGFVRGIVEHLNIKKVTRVIELRDRVYQALDHIALVKDRKLYGNLWPVRDRRWRR